MGDMIQINCGKTGNKIGSEYLNKLIYDHSLTFQNDQNEVPQNLSVSFNEQNYGQLSYRGIFMDFDSQNIDRILTSQQNSYINPDLVLSSDRNNVTGTFHQGKNIFKDQFHDSFVEAVRQTVEKCDRFTSFCLPHSTFDQSCGLANEALLACYEDYTYKFFCTYSVFPTFNANQIEIYNFGFSLKHIVENFFATMVYDYSALERAARSLNQDCCDSIIAETMLQTTCSQRFPGFQNGDLSKIMTNLIHFPRMHFLTCAFSPLYGNIFSQISLLSQPFNSYYTYPQDAENMYNTQALIVRSEEDCLEIQQINQKPINRSCWIGDGYHYINCKVKHRSLGETLLHIGNHVNFGTSIRGLSEQFTTALRRKGFLHYYYSEGCDEMDFNETESNLSDFVSEYVQCTQGVFSDYEEDQE